ncbi:MAG TPA: hypothetical protein VJR29_12445 [bacterium]|nr:hypothetical protein [bacterium]
MGGKVWINDTSGERLYEAYYAENAAICEDVDSDSCLEEYRLDGVINDLEIRDARIRLEKTINNPWRPLFPWKIENEEPAPFPDGLTKVVTVHMDERYLGNTGWWIFQPEERIVKSVTMNMRWENGKIRLYQCEPPPYVPPAEQPEKKPVPPIDDDSIIASILNFIFGPPSEVASL